MGRRSMITGADRGPTAVPQSIYAQSKQKYYPLGTRLMLGERVFHYALNGGVALKPGYLCQAEVPTNAWTNLTIPTNYSVVADSTNEITVTLGGSAVTIDELADGWLWAETTGTHMGACYKIKSHPAQSSGTGNVKITLYDDIANALTAGSDTVSMVKNMYQDVIVKPASAPTGICTGIPLIDVTLTSSPDYYYFWLQTWGPCACLEEGTPIIGHMAVADDGVAGAIFEGTGDDDEPIVGHIMDVGAASKMVLLYLRLAP